MLFSKDRLIEECVLVTEALRCVEAGDRGELAPVIEDLCSFSMCRTSPDGSKRDRRLFVGLYPAVDAPLLAFDEALKEFVRRGVDHWIDPANRADLVELAEAAGELVAALRGRAEATPPAKSPAEHPSSAENRAMAIALRMVREGKSPIVTRIADEAGCSRQFLYRCPRFLAFLATCRGDLPEGWKDDGNLEAYDRRGGGG